MQRAAAIVGDADDGGGEVAEQDGVRENLASRLVKEYAGADENGRGNAGADAAECLLRGEERPDGRAGLGEEGLEDRLEILYAQRVSLC